jgi:galactose-1-phosphate uridylyltransferase
MNVFLPRPSDINKIFYENYSRKPEEAIKLLHQLNMKMYGHALAKVETTIDNPLQGNHPTCPSFQNP